MKFRLICLLLMASWNVPNAVSQTLVDSILKMYKKTTLSLRNDVYQSNSPIFDSYDYVIVGASPSGCVLANRLTENPETTVLLLEAGYEPHIYNDIPALNFFFLDSDYNWKYSSQYNPGVCRSMNNEICPWPSGKGIGGGTTLNALLYTRGNKRDFDNWAREGNIDWGYDDILKYFNKMEDTRIPNLRDSPYRGKDGPVVVSYAPFRSNASFIFMEAGNELGYPIIDYNIPYTSGFAKMQLSLKEGFRSSASNAYLKPVIKRPNLHIAQRSFVSKIIVDSETNTALGVEFIKKGRNMNVMARKEVILSAGAFGSPKILMLSGIGPRDHLESLNIRVLQDLPVGNNLQEHLGAQMVSFTADPSESFVPQFAKTFPTLPSELLNYERTRSGPLSTCSVDSVAYVSSRYSTDENPDIELLFISVTFGSDFGHILRKGAGIRDDVYNSHFKPLERTTSFTILVMGCYPKSKGTVRLSSTNPFDNPIINNNFLNETEDINVIVDGIKRAIEIAETKAMKAYGVQLYKRNQPGCENITFGTDEYWACAVRQITAQYHHQSGTCKMGPDGDPTSVVDPRLRVRGVQRLRVVDASIMPTIPAGHTQAPAFMIGEKAADMIKEDNGEAIFP